MCDREAKMRLLMVLLGMILLGVLSCAAAIQEVDYEARNYYNGDYDDDFSDSPTSLTDHDVIDRYLIAGARARAVFQRPVHTCF